jgi:protein-disulfide isomerase
MRKDVKVLALVAVTLVAVVVVGSVLYRSAEREKKQEQVAEAQKTTAGEGGAFSVLIRPHSPVLGPKDAKVTLVEFLDPECESCRMLYPMVKHLLAQYGGRVRFVLRYMPLHQNSMYAASALEAAGAQGRYWDMLEIMFREQPRWGDHHHPKPEIIPELAKQIGLDMDKFNSAVVDPVHKAKVEMDAADGRALGVRATPTFFVNGREVEQLGYDSIKAMIDAALAN